MSSNAEQVRQAPQPRDALSLLPDIEAVCADYGLEMDMPRQVEDAAAGLAAPDVRIGQAGRRDLRSLPMVTIDGADAQDFDDAVHCRKGDAGDFVLTVVIADVSEFVVAGSLLDKEARQRATSAYFPGKVLPMLPTHLSNGHCSLLPGEDRLGLACEARVDGQGKVSGHAFFDCVINSHRRLTYLEAEEEITHGRDDGAVGQSLRCLADMTRILEKSRARRGGLQIDLPTQVIGFDDQGNVRFSEARRLFAHSVVEECMLVANTSAADMLSGKDYPFLYRVHAKPEPEKIRRLQKVMREFGVRIGNLHEPREMQKVIDSIATQPPLAAKALTMNILRTLMRAQYTPDNVFHYGLGYKRYTHFTSPIRRYPDLLVHRAIKAVLRGERPPDGLAGTLVGIGQHCSEREMSAERAGFDVHARVFGKRQAGRVGEVMEGAINGMSKGGMFVTCADGLEGRVSFAAMKDDYYEVNREHTAAVGRRRRRSLHVGMIVSVRLANVNADDGRCGLKLAG